MCITPLWAVVASARIFQLTAAAGVVVTLASVWLHWNAPWKQFEVEEAVKNGRLSAHGARRRARVWRWLAPATSVAGMTLLAVAALGLLRT